jgi:hypothetical protein
MIVNRLITHIFKKSDRDRKVVGFTTTYVINVYHY